MIPNPSVATDRAGSRRDPDREPLGEVVDPDGRGDRQPPAERLAPCGVELELQLSGLGGQRGGTSPARDRRGPRWPRPHPLLQHRQPGAPRGEPGAHQHDQPDQVRDRAVVVFDEVQLVIDDREAVGEHVDEDERQDPDGEHRQADPGLATQQLQPPHGQPEEDGEAGEGSERGGFAKRHVLTRS
jgi:hypothetical protein